LRSETRGLRPPESRVDDLFWLAPVVPSHYFEFAKALKHNSMTAMAFISGMLTSA
jgi:hypothetical protein